MKNKFMQIGQCHLCTVVDLPRRFQKGLVKCDKTGEVASFGFNIGFEIVAGSIHPELGDNVKRFPLVGEKIMALVGGSEGRYRVHAWCYAPEYDVVVAELKKRPLSQPIKVPELPVHAKQDDCPCKACHGGKAPKDRRYPSIGSKAGGHFHQTVVSAGG